MRVFGCCAVQDRLGNGHNLVTDWIQRHPTKQHRGGRESYHGAENLGWSRTNQDGCRRRITVPDGAKECCRFPSCPVPPGRRCPSAAEARRFPQGTVRRAKPQGGARGAAYGSGVAASGPHGTSFAAPGRLIPTVNAIASPPSQNCEDIKGALCPAKSGRAARSVAAGADRGSG
jgi:hypothetical protein